MTWASDGGEGGQRWSDKTWWPVGFIKGKLQCSCDKTFNRETLSDRTVAQLVSLNSQFPEDRAFRTRGLRCFSTACGAEVPASQRPRPLPHFTFPVSSWITQEKPPLCTASQAPRSLQKVLPLLQASAWDNLPPSH